MKKHKHDLRAYVKGTVHIEPGAAKRVATKAFAGAFSKFWGYPLLVVGSEEEALTCDVRGKLCSSIPISGYCCES